MSRSRNARHRALHLKVSVQVRARRYFAWFTLFATGLQAAVVNEHGSIDGSVLELRMAVLAQSASEMYAGSSFGSNQRWVFGRDSAVDI